MKAAQLCIDFFFWQYIFSVPLNVPCVCTGMHLKHHCFPLYQPHQAPITPNPSLNRETAGRRKSSQDTQVKSPFKTIRPLISSTFLKTFVLPTAIVRTKVPTGELVDGWLRRVFMSVSERRRWKTLNNRPTLFAMSTLLQTTWVVKKLTQKMRLTALLCLL